MKSIVSRGRSARAASIERAMPTRTVFVTHPACNHHDNGPGHPENQERLPALLAAVRAKGELEIGPSTEPRPLRRRTGLRREDGHEEEG